MKKSSWQTLHDGQTGLKVVLLVMPGNYVNFVDMVVEMTV